LLRTGRIATRILAGIGAPAHGCGFATASGMATRTSEDETPLHRAEPLLHQQAHETQPYRQLIKLPIALADHACRESVENLNQLLADVITLRDLYKKHHWQVSGPTFYQLHLLFATSSRMGSSTRLRSAFSCSAA
jgi:hypothetical protein